MPDTNPKEYATGYIMPVLSVDEPEIVAPFTAENFRKANDIASNADVQSKITLSEEEKFSSTVALGGIAQNTTFVGKTALEILRELLNVEGFPVAPGLPTITATMTVNSGNKASSYQLGETLKNIEVRGSNPNRNKITQYKTYSGELLDLTKFMYYNSSSNTIETIDKNDADYAGNFQGYIDEYTGEEKFIGPQNSYSYTVYGVFNDGNEYVGTKRTATDYNKTKTVQYINTSANRAKASVSFTVTIPWFAIGKNNTNLVYQSDKNFSYTSLPTNSMSTSSTTGGIEALDESSTSDLRMAFLVPSAWLGSSFKIYQFNETSKTYDIDRTGIFKKYEISYSEIPTSTTGKENIKGVIEKWAYIVHEGDPISNWKLFLKKG